jgi:hypothetical protein
MLQKIYDTICDSSVLCGWKFEKGRTGHRADCAMNSQELDTPCSRRWAMKATGEER